MSMAHQLIVQDKGHSALSYSQASRWWKAFKEGPGWVAYLTHMGYLLNSYHHLSVQLIVKTFKLLF